MKRDVQVFESPAAATAALAEKFAAAAINSKGNFYVALSGGSTPRALYALLAAEYRDRLPWDRLHFFWGDERCVPVGHADRNDLMATEAMLSKVPVPRVNIHSMPAELEDHEEAARRYDELLRKSLHWPSRFDWIFLGLGADGHTASLFPGTDAVWEKTRLAVPVWVEKLNSHRLTLTLPVLNSAAVVAFLAVGADKSENAALAIEGAALPKIPASLVRPPGGELLWYLDRDAASRLSARA